MLKLICVSFYTPVVRVFLFLAEWQPEGKNTHYLKEAIIRLTADISEKIRRQ